MLNVALTGNIAAGKSAVVELFRRWGATIVDADEIVREAQAPGSEVLAAIARRFGADVLAADGSLDRAALRSKVMGDDDALASLNAIVHPAVKRRRDQLHEAARRRGDALLVNDIPLLFEVLDPAQFDLVVLVDADTVLRRTRLRAMRGLANEDADRMIASQMPAERKRALSHMVIENNGSLSELEVKVRAAFDELRRRAAARALGGGGGGGGNRAAPSLLLVAADARETAPLLKAAAARYHEAGATVHQVHGKAPAVLKAVHSAKPGAILATAAAAPAARTAWEQAGRPGVLVYVSDDPDPVAVRLDLRPWGHDRVALGEAGATGLAPRADLFP